MNRSVLMIGLLLLFAACAFAAETDTATQGFNVAVGEIAAVDVTGNPGDLLIDNPQVTAGGAKPGPDSDATTRVQYTSIINDLAKARTITAEVSAGVVPAGLALSVVAGAPAAGGLGDKGAAAAGGKIELGDDAVVLLDSIGSCWTGTGEADGAALTYTLAIDESEIGALKVGAADVTVTLTLTGEG